MATAQSLAETTAMHLSISRTVICSPSSRYTQLPPKEAALALAVTTSSRLSLPLSMSSMISSIVITLVTLAGNRRSCAFFSYSTVPVSFSISSADGAETLSALSVRDTVGMRSPDSARPGARLTNNSIHAIQRFILASRFVPQFATAYAPRPSRMQRLTELCIFRQIKMDIRDRAPDENPG